jgi:hypothetical protein
MDFAPIDGKTRFTKAEMIASAKRRGYPTNEAQFERWVDYGLLGKGQKEKQGHWSLPQMHLFLTLLDHNRRPGVGPLSLCTIPVWGWLYLGPEADIQTEQVERVMWTWQEKQMNHPKDGRMRETAREIVTHIAHPKASGKRKLQQKIIAFAETIEYPMPEEWGLDPEEDFLDALTMVIDPKEKGDHQGPEGAPLSSESLSWHFRVNRKAIQTLLQKQNLPRKYWHSARNILLTSEARYQQVQPQFARETEGSTSATLFQKRTLNEIVNQVCYDVRLVLGCLLDQPALCETWEHVEVTSTLVISPLLLADGSHYSYLRIKGTSPVSTQ